MLQIRNMNCIVRSTCATRPTHVVCTYSKQKKSEHQPYLHIDGKVKLKVSLIKHTTESADLRERSK
jgi:hypothetical protein